MGGNFQGGIYMVGNFPGAIFQGGNMLGGNSPGDNLPGGNFPSTEKDVSHQKKLINSKILGYTLRFFHACNLFSGMAYHLKR